jgi:hypothetical protein
MSWSSSVIEQRPAGTALRCVAGLPFIVTVELQDQGGDPLSGVSDVTAGVFTLAGQELGPVAPDVTNLSTGVYSLSWTGGQTGTIGQVAAHSYSFGCEIDSDGPYAILAGGISATPPNVAGSSTATTLPVAVTVGGGTVQVTVALGGGGGSGGNGPIYLEPVEWVYLSLPQVGSQIDPCTYDSVDGSGVGDTLTQDPLTQASNNTNYPGPTTIDEGVNDQFVFTGEGGNGSPETFTMAPGDYGTPDALAACAAAATGSVSGEPLSTYVAVTVSGDDMFFTAVTDIGSDGNGDIFTGVEGNGGAAALNIVLLTLLGGFTPTVLTVDGGNPADGDRVCVAGAGGFNYAWSGVYVVTATDAPWVLTRATDNDTVGTLLAYWAVQVGPGGTGEIFGPGATVSVGFLLDGVGNGPVGNAPLDLNIAVAGAIALGVATALYPGAAIGLGAVLGSEGFSAALQDPVINGTQITGPLVQTVQPGGGIDVDDTDPANPIVSVTGAALWSEGSDGGLQALDGNSSGENAVAVGAGANASGAGSLAIGQEITASGAGSVVLGSASTASGDASVAVGASVYVTGYAAVGLGYQSYAAGPYSVAIGHFPQANGNSSTALGQRTLANGDDSLAEGLQTTTIAQESHAEGFATATRGDNSHAQGHGSVAAGGQSDAAGYNTVAWRSGENAESGGKFADHSPMQVSRLTMAAATTDATPTGLSIGYGNDNGFYVADLVLTPSTLSAITGTVAARSADGSLCAMWSLVALVDSGSTPGSLTGSAVTLPVTITADGAQASFTADSAPDFPVTITEDVNDQFSFVWGGGPTEDGTTFEGMMIAPGTYDDLDSFGTAIQAASTGDIEFATYATVSNDGTKFVFTAALDVGIWGNSDQIADYNGAAAAFGVTHTTSFTNGGQGNGQVLYSPKFTSGIGEMFTISPGTYTTLADLISALSEAAGQLPVYEGPGPSFGDYVVPSDDGSGGIALGIVAGINGSGGGADNGATVNENSGLGLGQDATFSGATNSTRIVSQSITLLGHDSGAADWAVALATSNDGCSLTATGEADTTIRWVASLEITEVRFAQASLWFSGYDG